MTLAKRGANRMIYEIALPSCGAEPIGFLCECGDPDCEQVLWFTADGFDGACADPDWHALAAGHEVVAASAERGR